MTRDPRKEEIKGNFIFTCPQSTTRVLSMTHLQSSKIVVKGVPFSARPPEGLDIVQRLSVVEAKQREFEKKMGN